jgi:hypothetical protein
MKIVVSVMLCSLLLNSFAQVPFQKDKKWGISKNGGQDSVIVRPDYDEIKTLNSGDLNLFIGLKNDEWQTLTKNQLVNQQRYESITINSADERFAICAREGYIDILSVKNQDFLIRGVKATDIISNPNFTEPDTTVLTTILDGHYGLVDIATKKEILKAEFTHLRSFEMENLTFLGVKGSKNYIYNRSGVLQFELNFATPIVKFAEMHKSPLCYQLESADVGMGWYDVTNKWFVPPIYSKVEVLDKDFVDAVIVYAKKGTGLYFQGKLIAECIYDGVRISDKRGFVAIVSKKGKEYLVDSDGNISPNTKD